MFNEPVLKMHKLSVPQPEPKATNLDVDELFWYKPNLESLDYSEGGLQLSNRQQGNLISSLRRDGKHRLLIDLDNGAFFADNGLLMANLSGHNYNTGLCGGVLIESSTPGHMHYYGPLVSFTELRDTLERLKNAGVVQEGFYNQLDRFGMVFLRPWWVKKGKTIENVTGSNMLANDEGAIQWTTLTKMQ